MQDSFFLFRFVAVGKTLTKITIGESSSRPISS